MKTYQELYESWMHADCDMVAGFNEEIAEKPPTVEEELAFAHARMANMGTALATLLRMLADESDGK